MPIVVRELIIRARVDENTGGRSGDYSEGNARRMESLKTEKIVSLCVEKVMEALERKKDR